MGKPQVKSIAYYETNMRHPYYGTVKHLANENNEVKRPTKVME